MTDPNTPYRFYEFWVPKHGVFKNETSQWTNIVGSFIKQIVDGENDLIYWFVQEGRWFQFCYASSRPDEIAAKIRGIQKKVGIRTKRILRGDVGGALAGTRWLSKAGLRRKSFERARSVHMLRACHAYCALFLHSLEKRGKHWVTETSACTKQNPHGNLFESFMHLIANTTQAQFDVKVSIRTGWMRGEQPSARLTCHL
jgi:hypothetical protein